MLGYFGYRVLFLSSRNRSVTTVQRLFMSINNLNSNERVNNLASLYDVNSEKVSEMIERNKKLKTCPMKRLERLLEAIRNMQIDPKAVEKYPKIATINAGSVKYRFYCLMELGFDDVNVEDILHYSKIMRKNINSKTLTWNPVEAIIENVEGPENLRSKIINSYQIVNAKNRTLKWLHRLVVLEYLKWKFNLEEKQAIGVITKYRSIANASIANLEEIINMLLIDFNFTMNKIYSNGFLLLLSKESINKLILMNPVLGGIPIHQFVLTFPRILSLDPVNVKEVKNHLQHFDIRNEAILRSGNIFSLKSSTVLKRLEEIEKYPELMEMKSDNAFLELIYYFDKIVDRLLYLKSLNLDCTINILIRSQKEFELRVHELQNRQKRKEISQFLANKCNQSFDKVNNSFNSLRKFHWYKLEVEKVKNTFEYLLDNDFNEKEILKNLPVVLFDVELVKNAIEDVNIKDLKLIQEKVFESVGSADNKKLDDDTSSSLKYGKIASERSLSVKRYLNQI